MNKILKNNIPITRITIKALDNESNGTYVNGYWNEPPKHRRSRTNKYQRTTNKSSFEINDSISDDCS